MFSYRIRESLWVGQDFKEDPAPALSTALILLPHSARTFKLVFYQSDLSVVTAE